MCLGVPGLIMSVGATETGLRMGRVSFAGITKDVCLAYVPEAGVGDYVVVHVGFAISQVDAAEALQVFEYLKQLDDLDELDVPQPS